MEKVHIPHKYLSLKNLGYELSDIVVVLTHPKVFSNSDRSSKACVEKSEWNGELFVVSIENVLFPLLLNIVKHTVYGRHVPNLVHLHNQALQY